MSKSEEDMLLPPAPDVNPLGDCSLVGLPIVYNGHGMRAADVLPAFPQVRAASKDRHATKPTLLPTSPSRQSEQSLMMAVVLPVIAQCDDVPERLHPMLRGYTLAAARCHDPDLVEISPEQLSKMAERVFSDGWTTNTAPRVPCMRVMTMELGSIRVGKFREDLPPSSDKQAAWDKKHNPDAPSRLLVDTSRSKAPQTHAARKKGKPAYFRARLDKLCDRIDTDFMDATGKWAPAAYVELDNGTDKLTSAELFDAYNQADQSRERIVLQYNIDLCAYLWQKVLYNYWRYDNFWNPVQAGVVDYNVKDFVVPPLIANQYRRIREDIEWIQDRLRYRAESLF